MQVAASLIEEMAVLHRVEGRPLPEVFVSDEVLRNVVDPGGIDLRPMPRRWRLTPELRRQRHRHDAVLTVFGPVYGPRVAPLEVMGYADVSSVYDQSWSGRERATTRTRRGLRRALSRASVRRADHVISETDEFRRALVDEVGVAASRVSVIPNTYHRVFDDSPTTVASPRPSGPVRLLYVARAYPHKNHDFLGQVGRELAASGGPRVSFVVTLSDQEWAGLSDATRQHCENVGPVDVAALPALYAGVDGVVFPSLLEAFSATPLEAARAGKPLFAADRGFVRSVVGDMATYFDPLDAVAAARTLHEAWQHPDRLTERTGEALRLALSWPTGADRARSYLDLVDRLLGDTGRAATREAPA
ncbi:MAG: glycosyltransferase [Humibacillus sp.]|nr:glycosyltransferase [Humibacillus sp.]